MPESRHNRSTSSSNSEDGDVRSIEPSISLKLVSDAGVDVSQEPMRQKKNKKD